jgi:histidine ammonia-lyase
MLAACQAIDMQEKKLEPGVGTKAAYSVIRKHIPVLEKDRWLGSDMDKIINLAFKGSVLVGVEKAIGRFE